jgi:hypothetical protein
MNVGEASVQVEKALASPLVTWPGYIPAAIPVLIFDTSDFMFFNHPDSLQERPAHLVAATAIELNGVLTATIPVEQCQDGTDLIPILYHECFHVYQIGSAFRLDEQFDFFRALAFYPELDATYRALCLAEIEVIDSASFSSREKAAYLARLAEKRHRILAVHDGLLAFVHHLERLEGTAYYVEQRAREAIFGIPAEMFSSHYGGVVPSKVGWTRHHAVGAAICRLLDEVSKGWQAQVAAGASLSTFLIQEFGQEEADLANLALPDRIAQEQDAAARVRAGFEADIAQLVQEGSISIRWPPHVPVMRSLRPAETVSLGDGRLIHAGFYVLQLPNGTIHLRSGPIVEDYRRCEVRFPAVPLRRTGDRLEADTEKAQISLTGVRELADGAFELVELG